MEPNLGVLADCLRGESDAAAPLRLVWNYSAMARQNLIAGHDRHRHAPAVALDALFKMLNAHGIEVELR